MVSSLTPSDMRHISALLVAVGAAGCAVKQPHPEAAPSQYLYVWAGPHGAQSVLDAGPHASTGSNFLAVLDADPSSRTYGKVLASTAAGVPGSMAHHTELSSPVHYPLFASDYSTGQIFLFDLTDARAPRLAARIDSVPGFRRPHSFARLSTGNVIATLQFGDGSLAGDPGGLAEFDPAGRLLGTSSAADLASPGARIRPNGLELLPRLDRAITTSMPMDDERTADVIQVWRISDLRLLHTLPLPAQAGDSSNRYPYDMRLLADGRTGMLNTYYCDLYWLSDLASERPRIEFVHSIQGPGSEGCAVTVVVGRYLVVPVADAHAVVALDVTDPARPLEVSRLPTDSMFFPHWIVADPRSDRLVVNSADAGEARVLIVRLDRTSGRLSWDERFRDAGSDQRGVSFDRQQWPHGRLAHAMAHAAVFGMGPR